MFRGYNLQLKKEDWETPASFNECLAQGKILYEGHQAKVEETIDAFTNEDGELNGSMMRANWFPSIPANIFISHSHAKLAILGHESFCEWYSLQC